MLTLTENASTIVEEIASQTAGDVALPSPSCRDSLLGDRQDASRLGHVVTTTTDRGDDMTTAMAAA